jgi:hypothetical protein
MELQPFAGLFSSKSASYTPQLNLLAGKQNYRDEICLFKTIEDVAEVRGIEVENQKLLFYYVFI